MQCSKVECIWWKKDDYQQISISSTATYNRAWNKTNSELPKARLKIEIQKNLHKKVVSVSYDFKREEQNKVPIQTAPDFKAG